MKVEIFTLCDAATVDAGGKLNILGSFDRLNVPQVPAMHPQCSLAMKLRFERLEEGKKRLRIAFVNSDGAPLMPAIDVPAEVHAQGNDSTSIITMVLNVQQLNIQQFGEYAIHLIIDDRHEFSIPLFVPGPL